MVLPEPKGVSDFYLIFAWFEIVEFVEILQSQAIHLRNVVHTLACLYHMWLVFVFLGSLLFLLTEIKDVADG